MRREILGLVALAPAVLATGLDNPDGNSDNFTIVNGQIFTPGLAIIDAPQPYTPEGGDFLQVAIDVSGDGKLPWPPSTQSPNATTFFHNITIFLTSVVTTKNFTISNGSIPVLNVNGSGSSAYSPYVPPVLGLEPSSTVKHVNWLWPSCLVGNGDSNGSGNGDGDGLNSSGNARGAYNISIHQSFRWNDTDYYTVFDLPISVSNSINASPERVNCGAIENQFLGIETVDSGSPWVNGSGFNGSGTPAGTSPGSGGEIPPAKSFASRKEVPRGFGGMVTLIAVILSVLVTLA